MLLVFLLNLKIKYRNKIIIYFVRCFSFKSENKVAIKLLYILFDVFLLNLKIKVRNKIIIYFVRCH